MRWERSRQFKKVNSKNYDWKEDFNYPLKGNRRRRRDRRRGRRNITPKPPKNGGFC